MRSGQPHLNGKTGDESLTTFRPKRNEAQCIECSTFDAKIQNAASRQAYCEADCHHKYNNSGY